MTSLNVPRHGRRPCPSNVQEEVDPHNDWLQLRSFPISLESMTCEGYDVDATD